MDAGYVRQPDGRLVAGPDIPTPAPPRRIARYVACALALCIPAAFLAGRSAQPSLHELLVERVEAGCLVQFHAVSTDDAGKTDLVRDAIEAVRVLSVEGMREVEGTTREATDGIRRFDPTATYYGLVSWQECG